MTAKEYVPDPPDYTPAFADQHRCTARKTNGRRCGKAKMGPSSWRRRFVTGPRTTDMAKPRP